MEETTFDTLQAVVKSRADHVESLIKEDIEHLETISSRIKRHMDLESYNNFSNKDGKNFLNDILLDANESIDDIQDIFIINLTGICIASTNSVYENISHLNERYFLKGKTNNSLSLLLENKSPKIFISCPFIFNKKLLGVIVIITSPNLLFDALTDTTGLGKTGESYIVNKYGFVITPLRFYNYSYNIQNIILKKKINTENYHNCMLHAIYSDEELEKRDHEKIKFEDYRNKKVVGAHAYISDTQWALLVEIDETEAFGPVNSMQYILSWILVIFSSIILFVAFFYARSISKPIKELDACAKEITEGNLNIKADIDTSDELRDLAQSFNTMTNRLKDYTKNLEQKIEERTVKLKEKIDELERFKKVTVCRELKMIELKKQLQELQDSFKIGEKNFDD